MSEKDVTEKPKTTADDEYLEKLAVEELMREAVQGAARAEIVGPSGWIKTPQNKTNKRFLVNTIRHAVASNKYNFSKRSHKQTSRTSYKTEKPVESPIVKDKLKKKH